MRRRELLSWMGALAPLPALATSPSLPTITPSTPVRLAACWRGPRADSPHEVGVLEADWNSTQLRLQHRLTLPGRAHGLSVEPDGGLLVVAARPGDWLLRCDAQGRLQQRHPLDDDAASTRLNGHATGLPDGDVIYTAETDVRSGRGRIGVRDRQSLRKLDEWDSHGLEPHQLLMDHEGRLMVANGGIPRTADDRKHDLHRMESSLVRLDARSGALLGRWTLPDPRLSLRHMAWADEPAQGPRALGLAMEAVHDTAQDRARAPVFALFEHERLTLPATQNDRFGYSGDIAAAFGGGFVMSSHQTDQVLLWHPSQPTQLRQVVAFRRAYALATWHGPDDLAGALVATGLGLVRWHPTDPGRFMVWPEPMALDNHWVLLPQG